MRRSGNSILLWAYIMLFSTILSACTPVPDVLDRENPAEDVNLIYYTIGNPDADLKLVNDELNKLLKEKIGVTISYNKVAWDEYDSYITSLIAAGQAYDICFAANYATNALSKSWLALDGYLDTIGKPMYEAIHPTFWEGVTISVPSADPQKDGALDRFIYGVPTNKELAVLLYWMFPRELIDKYNVNLSQYTSLESLEPLFATIKENEPEYLVMELDKNSHNFFAYYGYEYITNRTLPLMVKSEDETPQIISVFETQECREILNVLRRYYLAGYINSDASTFPSSALEKGKKVFFKLAEGGPFSDTIWSQQRGYDVVTHTIYPTIVTTESARGGIMCVNAGTQYPEESVKFLNCLNTDSEVRNMFNYGIENIHYTLDGNNQVIEVENTRYAGVQYTQGNWYLLKTRGGPTPEPINKWEVYQEFNDAATISNILGFTPDLRNHFNILQRIEQVNNKYYPSLMTGTVDVETYLPRFREELAAAGINDLKAELQRQLDAWLENNRRS